MSAMPNRPTTFFQLPPAQPTLTAPQGDRRLWVRYPSDLEVSCQPALTGTQAEWTVRVGNVSAEGILLLVYRRFEPKTLLQIGWQSPGEDTPHTLLVRVIHVIPQRDGGWGMGCAFGRRLCGDELQAFLAAPADVSESPTWHPPAKAEVR
jgi:hypothetical protein